MMIRFPQQLNKIFKFERGGKIYAADLTVGCVVEMDEVTSYALELSERFDTSEVIKRLEERYGKEKALDSIGKLASFARIGMFFRGERRRISGAGQQKLFISPVFLRSLNRFSFVTRVDLYRLITSLAELINLSMGVYREHTDRLDELNSKGIETVLIEEDKRISPAALISEEYSGILSLSMSFVEEAPFNLIGKPVINLAYSDRSLGDKLIQSAIDLLFMLRPWAVLCCDASWTANAILKFAPKPEGVRVIPPGVDHDLFKPMDKHSAKMNISLALNNHLFAELPIVIILSGLPLNEEASFVRKICRVNNDIAFLVLDPSPSDYLQAKPNNVEFFPIRDAHDYDMLPLIFNSAELLIFPATIGISSSLVFSGMACGLPVIAIGDQERPPELDEAGIFIKAACSNGDTMIVPVREVSDKLRSLLRKPEEMDHLRSSSLRTARRFSWELTAREIIKLFEELRKSMGSELQFKGYPIVFAYKYNRWRGEIESKAFQLPRFKEKPMEYALASELLKDHTPSEVELILTYISGDEIKAKEIVDEILSIASDET
ncbi:MAG: hypothetical protein DRN61_01225 [Thaumarchaeota archaeon]|nr:MAG: hypothetical protein DRN61_01225 [Nitrososphaerota archaeon]